MLNGWIVFDKKAGEEYFSADDLGKLKNLPFALEFVNMMDMKLCSVDLLFGENGYIVGEINSMPGCLHIVHEGKSNLQRLLEAFYSAVVKYVGNGK